MGETGGQSSGKLIGPAVEGRRSRAKAQRNAGPRRDQLGGRPPAAVHCSRMVDSLPPIILSEPSSEAHLIASRPNIRVPPPACTWLVDVKRKRAFVRFKEIDHPLVQQLTFGSLFPLIRGAVAQDVFYGFHREFASTGGGLFGEEPSSKGPYRGMSGNTPDQSGCKLVASPSFAHPRSTVDVGRGERGILLLVESQEVRADILLRLEQIVPAVQHTDNCTSSSEVSGYDRCSTCLNSR